MMILQEVLVSSFAQKKFFLGGFMLVKAIKRPCQHIDHEFRQAWKLLKKLCQLTDFLRKKLFFVENLTILPDLTVLFRPLLDFPCQQVQQDPHKRYLLLNFPFQFTLFCHQSSLRIQIRILDTRGTNPDPEKLYGSLRIRNTAYQCTEHLSDTQFIDLLSYHQFRDQLSAIN